MPQPISLTPQDGQIESASFTADGKYLYYGTNATDIEHRHIWRVPLAGGAPEQVTRGRRHRARSARAAVGKQIAVLSADYRRPQSVAIFPAATTTAMDASAQKVIYPVLTQEFPTDAHVEPEIVKFKAPDGLEISNQLFLPKDIRPARSVRRSSSCTVARCGRCCWATTTWRSITSSTASTSGSPARATSSSR